VNIKNIVLGDIHGVLSLDVEIFLVILFGNTDVNKELILTSLAIEEEESFVAKS
jgi:hypothetical protein